MPSNNVVKKCTISFEDRGELSYLMDMAQPFMGTEYKGLDAYATNREVVASLTQHEEGSCAVLLH